MSVRNILLIFAAVLITAGTGLAARSWLLDQRAQMANTGPTNLPPPPAIQVLIAADDIPTGTFVKESHLRWQAWPDEPLPDSYMVKPETTDSDPIADLNVIGAVVRRGISAGEPITAGRVLKSGERGFLAAVIRPGYRAMAIKVNATSSIAGLIFPGDRVDIILTHAISRGNTQRRASETVLTNVRILSIDQTVDDQEGQPRVGKNATLELTPKQAEMLAVLTDLGKLSLSLRSLAKDEEELERLANSDEPLAEPDPARGSTHTWDTEVSRLLWSPSKAKKDVVQVIRGKQRESQTVNKSKTKKEAESSSSENNAEKSEN
jgi:pilus assembly protein CpaB